MSSYIPSPYVVGHAHRAVAGPKDSHGNRTITAGAVVQRRVQSINQFGRRGSSRAIFSTETAGREEVTLHMSVDNPDVYANGDQVLIGAQFDSVGNYIPGTGTAYTVDGDPSDERNGPWPRYTKLFGGVVKIRRVT
jgi:hypothetical protein